MRAEGEGGGDDGRAEGAGHADAPPSGRRAARAEAAARRSTGRLAVAALAVMTAGLAVRFAPEGAAAEAAAWAARGAVAALLLAALPRLGWREAYLGAVSAALAGLAVWRLETPMTAILAGFDQGAFLAAFIFLLTLLHGAASGSGAVAGLGGWLTAQPPGRRYLAMFWGANVMAVTFNLGAVSLLTPLAQRGIEGQPEPVRSIRERRQVNAILRGFAWCVVWSPTSLAAIAVLELIPGVDRQWWSVWGLMLAGAVFCVGWAEDRLSVPAATRRAGAAARAASAPERFPRRDFLGFAGATAALFGLMAGLGWLSGGSLVTGLLAACPLLALGWAAGQGRLGGFVSEARERLLPEAAPVAATLAFSGFIGRAGAALLPPDALGTVLAVLGLPDWAVLAGIPLAIVTLSFFAVSPIMTAVFFGSLLGAMETLPASPTLVALSVSSGWALAMTASPFATLALVMARLTGREPWRLTLVWNARFTPLAFVVVVAACILATGGR